MADDRPTSPAPRRALHRMTQVVVAGWHRGRLPWLGGDAEAAPPDPSPYTRSESTRYLCAAAQLDDTFRAQVLRSTVEERHHAIAPSFGVDVQQVVKHCLVAERRDLVRDGCLTALLIALVPAVLLGPLHSRLTLTVFILAAAYVIVWSYELTAYRTIQTRLRRGRFRPYEVTCNAEHSDVLSRVADRQKANLIVYGSYWPFVGSGVRIDGWSFTVDIRHGKEDPSRPGCRLNPEPFRCRDLYDDVAEGITHLGLEGVNVEDRLYIDGRGIRDDPRFIPDPFSQPSPRVDSSVVDWFVDKPTPSIRHYQCIQAVAWSGDLVVSFLVRFQKAGAHQFVEATILLLLPIHHRYKRVDRLPHRPLWKEVIHLVPEAASSALLLTPKAPLRLIDTVRRARSAAQDERQQKELIRLSPHYNYGARRSLREWASSDTPTHYFQVLDRQKHAKVLQAHLLDCIWQFLEEKNIDTTDPRKRGTTILNNGVIMTGGQMQAENIAMGKDSKIE